MEKNTNKVNTIITGSGKIQEEKKEAEKTPGKKIGGFQAEGNNEMKKILEKKKEQLISKADKNDGVRIKFNDNSEGIEVYSYKIEGFKGEMKVRSIGIKIHNSISIQKFETELAKKIVKYFGKRSQIIE